MARKKRTGNKKYIILLLVVVLIGAAYYVHNGFSLNREKPISNNNSSEKAPVKERTDNNQGYAVDNNGISKTPQGATNPKKSASGSLVVNVPADNSSLSNGFDIDGSSQISPVNYRLIDDQLGVISQGVLSVTDKNFGGKIYFSKHSSSGRLDIYNTDQNGREVNEVQIKVVLN